MERLFPTDRMSKRERVLAALRHQPVDRVPILEQVSYNPRVIADWTGKPISGFNYSLEDIGVVIRQTCDIAMPPAAPRGTQRWTDEAGAVYQNDNWTTWRVKRPFDTVQEALAWIRKHTQQLRQAPFDAATARVAYRQRMLQLQSLIGDTVILDYHEVGLCSLYDYLGLELFAYVWADYPEEVAAYVQAKAEAQERRIQAIADPQLSPVVMLADDFAAKHGLLFSLSFLQQYLFPFVAQLAQAWHAQGLYVLYHSDGNYYEALPALMACGVDGFYCLEPAAGMDIVALKRKWPDKVWAGGVDGVDLLERGTPQQVRAEVRRQILDTQALDTGGLFIASSSEITPNIPPENFRAMIEAVGELRRKEGQP